MSPEGFQGPRHLLFTISVATCELESCWFCWIFFFKRNQNLKFSPVVAEYALLSVHTGLGTGGVTVTLGRAIAGQKMGHTVKCPHPEHPESLLGDCAEEVPQALGVIEHHFMPW